MNDSKRTYSAPRLAAHAWLPALFRWLGWLLKAIAVLLVALLIGVALFLIYTPLGVVYCILLLAAGQLWLDYLGEKG